MELAQKNSLIESLRNDLGNLTAVQQYDTMDAAGRNADLVLQAGVDNYTPDIDFWLVWT